MEYNMMFEMARGHPFLRGLTGRQIEKMAALASIERFADGEIIYREGDRAESLYLILTGDVALESCSHLGVMRVLTLGGGEELGWWAFMEDDTRHFRARALSHVETLRFDHERLKHACREDHELCHAIDHQLLREIWFRLHGVLHQVMDVYGPHEVEHKAASAKIA